MRIRPGRTRSLVAGIVMLLIMVIGLVIMSSFPGFGGLLGSFRIIWVIVTLLGAGISFYNAFSRRGVPLYEVEMEDRKAEAFCPQCGRPVGQDDRFCRNCGAPLHRGSATEEE